MRFLPVTVPVSICLLLLGCSTPPMSTEQLNAINKDTLEISCEAGCTVSYTDPRDRPRMPTNGWDTANTAIGAAASVLTTATPWIAAGAIGLEGIKQAGDNDNSRVDNSVVDNSRRDDSVVDNRTVDTTHTPTVVNQPDPIIVNPTNQ